MITRKKIISADVDLSCLRHAGDDALSILFFDIETTGFSPKTSDLYMLGTGCLKGDSFEITQYFADCMEDEEQILKIFIILTGKYDVIAHYNGNTFDIPFIKSKSEQYGIKFDIPDSVKSFDLYKEILKYKRVFNLADYKQKTIERFLGIHRDDKMDGGELIKVYKDFIKDGSLVLRDALFLHNFDDIRGLIASMNIFKYIHILNGSFSDYNVSVSDYADSEGSITKELFIVILADYTFPEELTVANHFGVVKFKENKCYLSCRSYNGELKYFFSDTGNYYYLPLEDMAVHKSVAIYVDKNFRQKAKPANCYIKRQGDFFLSAGYSKIDLFKKDYKDSDYYLMYSDDLFKDKDFLDEYIRCILKTF